LKTLAEPKGIPKPHCSRDAAKKKKLDPKTGKATKEKDSEKDGKRRSSSPRRVSFKEIPNIIVVDVDDPAKEKDKPDEGSEKEKPIETEKPHEGSEKEKENPAEEKEKEKPAEKP